jgi:hypothetical protein
MSLNIRRSGTVKTEFVGKTTLEALGAMLDGLLEVGLDRANRDPELCGDFTIGEAFDTRKCQHASSSCGKLRDRAPEQLDFGAILYHPCGVGPVIGNVEEAVNLVDGQAAALGPPTVAGNVKCDAKQISLGISHRPNLVEPFEAQICFVKHVRSKVG